MSTFGPQKGLAWEALTHGRLGMNSVVWLGWAKACYIPAPGRSCFMEAFAAGSRADQSRATHCVKESPRETVRLQEFECEGSHVSACRNPTTSSATNLRWSPQGLSADHVFLRETTRIGPKRARVRSLALCFLKIWLSLWRSTLGPSFASQLKGWLRGAHHRWHVGPHPARCKRRQSIWSYSFPFLNNPFSFPFLFSVSNETDSLAEHSLPLLIS